ncbi:phosphoglycerate mutase family protein [Tenacibaculum jejuense]|uniref:Phosphoglycerate mutase n=1 Tax=Tenacibaculum jejuense TaxID=584609 RepID=A0A238UBK0_9FLAO|nr:phosphoglycerate mutase family protein [Tenacibaculum jejuense]SNR16549.1 Protein of unknown function [Tenacibaculum jejuense]
MKKIILLLSILLPLYLISQNESNITRFFFIRHAEKKLTQKDPDLTNKGVARAKEWANMFKHYKISKVFSTNYKRTIQTAQPIAKMYGLKIQIYDTKKINSKELIKRSKGENIVIVGHSNTIPFIVNRFIGKKKYKEINESIYGNLYIVTVQNGHKQDLLLSLK